MNLCVTSFFWFFCRFLFAVAFFEGLCCIPSSCALWCASKYRLTCWALGCRLWGLKNHSQRNSSMSALKGMHGPCQAQRDTWGGGTGITPPWGCRFSDLSKLHHWQLVTTTICTLCQLYFAFFANFFFAKMTLVVCNFGENCSQSLPKFSHSLPLDFHKFVKIVCNHNKKRRTSLKNEPPDNVSKNLQKYWMEKGTSGQKILWVNKMCKKN